jgi:hypothetical protein
LGSAPFLRKADVKFAYGLVDVVGHTEFPFVVEGARLNEAKMAFVAKNFVLGFPKYSEG